MTPGYILSTSERVSIRRARTNAQQPYLVLLLVLLQPWQHAQAAYVGIACRCYTQLLYVSTVRMRQHAAAWREEVAQPSRQVHWGVLGGMGCCARYSV
jgi:hypothetical protein